MQISRILTKLCRLRLAGPVIMLHRVEWCGYLTVKNTGFAVVQLVEYRTRNREVAGSTHTRSTASNLEQVANLLCAQAPQPLTLSKTGNE